MKLTKDGFERSAEEILLTDSDPKGTVAITLSRGSVSVDVSCKMAGTDCPNMSLALDGKSVPGQAIDNVSSGVTHTLVVSIPGASDQTFSFSGSPFEKKHFDVVASRVDDTRGADSVGAGGGSSSSSGHHSSSHASAAAPPAATPTAAPAAAQPVGSGKLNVGASGGWCNVTVDGVSKGATPVAGIDVSAGPHQGHVRAGGRKGPDGDGGVQADSTARYRFTLGQRLGGRAFDRRGARR